MIRKRAISLAAATVVAVMAGVGAGGAGMLAEADIVDPATPPRLPSATLQFAYTNAEKVHHYHQCCLRYVRGEPLSGLFCSRKELNYAIGRGVIRLITYSDGRSTCAPTGKPL